MQQGRVDSQGRPQEAMRAALAEGEAALAAAVAPAPARVTPLVPLTCLPTQ